MEKSKQMKTNQFFLLSLVVMVAFGVYVRGVLLRPKPPADGPVLVSHDLGPRYEGRCDVCHRKVVTFHEKRFGYFDDCMNCHGGAPRTPHPTGGGYAYCLKCHSDIVPSHDIMFPKNVTYDNCVGCHPAK